MVCTGRWSGGRRRRRRGSGRKYACPCVPRHGGQDRHGGQPHLAQRLRKDFDAAIYPKVSGTWVLSEESFWNVAPLGDFRLRAAWGEAGQQPDLFAAARLFESQPGPNDEPALTPIEFGNPDLAPETGSELEVGIDASFLERVGLSFTAYWKTTTDAIVQQPLAESTGFPSAQFVPALHFGPRAACPGWWLERGSPQPGEHGSRGPGPGEPVTRRRCGRPCGRQPGGSQVRAVHPPKCRSGPDP